jgi:dTMP kinase
VALATTAPQRASTAEQHGGVFVTLEGGEGAGKSTQLSALSERLADHGISYVGTREPGGTPLGERVRAIVLDLRADIHPLTEALLFVAARAELVATLIEPALRRGDVVLCDRFADSTVAYQGYGRGVPLDLIARANEAATRGLTPDLTVLFDLPAADGLARSRGTDDHDDRFEREELAFHERVRAGYRQLAETEPERWLVVDAARRVDEVTDAIWARLERLLASR